MALRLYKIHDSSQAPVINRLYHNQNLTILETACAMRDATTHLEDDHHQLNVEFEQIMDLKIGETHEFDPEGVLPYWAVRRMT